MKVIITIPAYNEEKTLPMVLDAVLGIAISKEIIVVDDGSRDRTAAIARERESGGAVALLSNPAEGTKNSERIPMAAATTPVE